MGGLAQAYQQRAQAGSLEARAVVDKNGKSVIRTWEELARAEKAHATPEAATFTLMR